MAFISLGTVRVHITFMQVEETLNEIVLETEGWSLPSEGSQAQSDFWNCIPP